MIPTSRALERIVEASGAAPMLFSTGYTSRRAAAFDRDNHFYMLGSMGLASAIGIGLAQSITPRPVWVIDGDASFLMNPTSSLLLAPRNVRNLHHVVLDNACNASTGGQPSLSGHTDLLALATGLGYPRVAQVTSLTALDAHLSTSIEDYDLGSTFLHCRVVDDQPPQARITHSLPGLRCRFEKWLQQWD